MAKKEKPKPTKYEVLGELLRNYGMGIVDDERFWRDMKRNGFDQDDIDWWCSEHYAREAS